MNPKQDAEKMVAEVLAEVRESRRSAREAVTHTLNTWPTYFDAVERGEKLFEVRQNDRFFQRGDIVELVRLSKDSAVAPYCFTGKRLRFRIGSILQGGQFGIEPGYCVFSLLPLAHESKEK